MANEYDISKAFKRIENDLIDSMMRNMARHQAEETEMGINWEQWQVLQLKELERYRKENIKKFGGDFSEINNRIEDLFRQTSADAMAKEEAKILDDIRKGRYYRQKKDVTFFNVNDQKLDVLIERTKADFSRAEYAVLRKADDQYRQIIYDAQVYGNVTNDYAKAVDMATHDFLQKGIQSVQYKNGARHNISEYSEMAIRTGNKRAYLMGEGNAHDEFGIHTIRVNKRTQACPLCVGFLGKVMVDDVYAGGTPKEAMKLGVPLLSQAIDAGFLHPNCKDIYSMYIDGISKKAEPWTQEEIETIVSKYNAEQELKRAEDMQESYARMAKYSLDPSNKAKYQARADNWQARADDIRNGMPPKPIVPPKPATPPTPPQAIKPFTDAEKDALEWYVSGDGMWINQYLRGIGDIGELSEEEKKLYDLLKQATNRPLEGNADVLYRSVDASAIFKGLSSDDLDNLMWHILYGDSNYDNGAYSQSLKQRMESIINNAQGKEITEKGFMSTTVDKTVAENWGDFTDAQHPIVLELDTAGVELKGADLDFLDIADDPQRERLLAPDVRYKITDIGVGEYENGGKYIKIKAQIIGQGEEAVAETVAEVAEAVAPPQVETAEQKVRTMLELDKTNLANAQKTLADTQAELEKIKQAEVEYASLKNALDRGYYYGNEKTVTEVIEKNIRQREDHPNWYADTADFWRFVKDNQDKLENGGFTDDKKAIEKLIKDQKKQTKALQKEVNARYSELEAIIGKPNLDKLASYGEKHTVHIAHFLDDAPAQLRGVWNKNADDFNVLSSTDHWGRRRNGAYYNKDRYEDGVWLSINKVSKGDDLHPAYETVFHEFGHNLDYVLNRKIGNGDEFKPFTEIYKNGAFGKTIMKEANQAIEEYGKANGILGREEIEKAFAKEIKGAFTIAERGDISDMFESTFSTGYPFGAGHGKPYWTKGTGKGNEWMRTGREAFAEMYASRIANNGSWELIQKYFPESIKIFDEMIEMGNVL